MKGIPKLNRWQAKFGPQGFTVVGVTDELSNIVEPFLASHELSYPVALGGARLYRERGLPHCWLISPEGDVLWEGRPDQLEESEIEKNLVGAWNPPVLELPFRLRRAGLQAARGNFGKAIAKFRAVADHEESPDRATALAALEELTTFGKAQLAVVESWSAAGRHGAALARLDRVVQGFAGTSIGAVAAELGTGLRQEKSVMLEVEAYTLLQSARIRMSALDRNGAKPLLEQAAAKKYSGTHSGHRSARLLAQLNGQ